MDLGIQIVFIREGYSLETGSLERGSTVYILRCINIYYVSSRPSYHPVLQPAKVYSTLSFTMIASNALSPQERKCLVSSHRLQRRTTERIQYSPSKSRNFNVVGADAASDLTVYFHNAQKFPASSQVDGRYLHNNLITI